MSDSNRPSNIIFVKDIPQGIHPQEFEDLFGRLPGYITMRRKPYFAFIEYKDIECATNAMRKYQSYKFHQLDRPLLIEYDKDLGNNNNNNHHGHKQSNNHSIHHDNRDSSRDINHNINRRDNYRDNRDTRGDSYYSNEPHSSSSSSFRDYDNVDNRNNRDNRDSGSNMIPSTKTITLASSSDKDYEQGMIIEKDILDDEERDDRDEKHKPRPTQQSDNDYSGSSSRDYPPPPPLPQQRSRDYSPPPPSSHNHYHHSHHTHHDGRKRYREDRYDEDHGNRDYPPPPQQLPPPHRGMMPPPPPSYMPPNINAGPTLFVSNLPRDVTERELSILFRFMRGFIGIRLINKNDRAPICFCDFDSVQSAAVALDALQGFRMDPKVISSSISIEFDKSNSSRMKHLEKYT